MIKLEASTLPTLLNAIELLVGPVRLERTGPSTWVVTPEGDEDYHIVIVPSEAGLVAHGR